MSARADPTGRESTDGMNADEATLEAIDANPADAPMHDHESHERDHVHHDDLEELVVTGTPTGRSRFSILQGTSVLQGEELDRKRAPSLGETLALEPGISSDFFTPAASRPVIRGQGSSRVRILNDGAATLDASAESPDHAVAAEPLIAQRIEVIRGPSTLLYGSAAAGGVVNVLTGRIPRTAPENGYSVDATVQYGSNGNLREGGGTVEAAVGEFVIHADGFARGMDDYQIPGDAESSELQNQEAGQGDDHGGHGTGVVENSNLETSGGALGVSWLTDRSRLGVAGSIYQSNYGIPGHEHDDAMSGAEEDPVRIDLFRWRIDLDGELQANMGPFDLGKLRFGYTGYTHQELEGGQTATTFENQGFDLRLEMVQRAFGPVDGAVGVQVTRNEFAATGEEAFIPASETRNLGLFFFEEVDLSELVLDGLGLEFGLRYENQAITATPEPGRNDNGVSVSGGLGWTFHPDYMVGITGFRNERLPASPELYSDGPHLATRSFDIGDAFLPKEVASGTELSFRRQGGRLTGGVSFYYTAYDDFIYRSETNESPIDGLPVFRYIARDATFIGAELDAHMTVWESEDMSVGFDFVFDYVRARLQDSDENLPRIPPLRVLGGIEFESTYVDLHFETQWANAQHDVAPGELPTDGYTMVNASLELRPWRGNRELTIFVRGRNLADVEARSHPSALKDLAPLPGRDIRVGMNIRF